EIGFENAFIVDNRRRIAAGQDRPLCKNGDVVGDTEDDVHVVLDDDNVDGVRQIADFRNRAAGLGRAHAASGLVQQKQARLGNQCHADLEHRDVTIGQGTGRTLCQSGEADLLERLLDTHSCIPVASGGAERIQEPVSRLPCDPEIVGNVEVRKHALDLKGPLDPHSADDIRPASGNVAAAKEYPAAARTEKARYKV